jgi:hypothetical protein
MLGMLAHATQHKTPAVQAVCTKGAQVLAPLAHNNDNNAGQKSTPLTLVKGNCS